MSHFVVAVLTKNYQDVEELMAPYCEQDEQYYEFFPLDESDMDENVSWYNAHHSTDNVSFDEFMDGEGYEKRDGVWGRLYNPNAKWDYWDPDRDWREFNVSKDGKVVPNGKLLARNLRTSVGREEIEKAEQYWEDVVSGAKNPGWPHGSKERFIEKYGSKENYVKLLTVRPPFAFVTPDGEWHERGEVCWFGISHTTPESICSHTDLWLDALKEYGDFLVTFVDCHI